MTPQIENFHKLNAYYTDGFVIWLCSYLLITVLFYPYSMRTECNVSFLARNDMLMI